MTTGNIPLANALCAVYDALGARKPTGVVGMARGEIDTDELLKDLLDAVHQQKDRTEKALGGPKQVTIRNHYKDRGIHVRIEPWGTVHRVWREGWLVIRYSGYIEEVEHKEEMVIVTFGEGTLLEEVSE